MLCFWLLTFCRQYVSMKIAKRVGHMNKEKISKQKLENAKISTRYKNIFDVTMSYINGYIDLPEMLTVSKRFNLIHNLDVESFRYMMKITDAQLDGQISSKEFQQEYKRISKLFTAEDKQFIKYCFGLIYSHDRTSTLN